MTYLYGDSTPSTLEINFIEFLRSGVQFCVQVLLAEQRIAEGEVRTRALDQATAAEIDRLEKLGGLVAKALDAAPHGEAGTPTARCAVAIVGSAGELVRGASADLRALLAAEVAKRDEEAVRERDNGFKALEALLVAHDLPDMTVAVHVAITAGGRYASRARVKTGYGLDAVLDLEIPEKHLLERIVRVDRLAERLDVQAPEMSGWLHKEIKLRPQHLEKHHLTEIMIGAAGGILKLRVAPEGTGPGFDVLVSKDAPRVRLARVDQSDGPVDPPFEVQEADAKKLLAAYEMVASATTALLQHRKGLAEATFDGERLRTHPKPSLLVERLIATMAPFVQEIAARSHSPGELVLRRLLSGDRREEIFLSKQELKLKLEPLQERNRELFAPLGIDGARPAVPAVSLASKSATQVTAVAPPPPPPPAEPPRAEPTRPKPEAAKPEAAKPEAAKPEAAKPEATKPEATKAEAAKPEVPKPEVPKPEPFKTEAAKPEPSKLEAPPAGAYAEVSATPVIPPPPPATPSPPSPPVESIRPPTVWSRPLTPPLGMPSLTHAILSVPSAPPRAEASRPEMPRRPSGPSVTLDAPVPIAPPPAPPPAAAPPVPIPEPPRKEASGTIDASKPKGVDSPPQGSQVPRP